MNRKIDPSIYPIRFLFISKKESISFKELRLAPPLMKRLCCNGWQRVRSTQSTGVIQ